MQRKMIIEITSDNEELIKSKLDEINSFLAALDEQDEDLDIMAYE